MRVTDQELDTILTTVTYETHHIEGTNLTAAWAFLPDKTYIGYGESIAAVDMEFNAEYGVEYAIENAKAAARQKLLEFLSLTIRLTGDKPDLLKPTHLDMCEIIELCKIITLEAAEYTLLPDGHAVVINGHEFTSSDRSKEGAIKSVHQYFDRIRIKYFDLPIKYPVMTTATLNHQVNNTTHDIMDKVVFTQEDSPVNIALPYLIRGTSECGTYTAAAYAPSLMKGKEDVSWELHRRITTEIRRQLTLARDKSVLLNAITVECRKAPDETIQATAHSFGYRFEAVAFGLTNAEAIMKVRSKIEGMINELV